MYGQPLQVQRNSSTSGFNATRDLQGCLSRNTTHQYYQSWRLGHEITLTAQRNTVGHKKGFPKNHLYSFTQRRSSTISQLYRGWFSQECRPEIKFLYQRVEVHSATKWWDAHIHANDETPWYLHYVRIPQCESVELPLALQQTEENGHPKRN